MLAKDFLKDNNFVPHRGKRTAEEVAALNSAIEQYGNIFSDYTYRKPKDTSFVKAPETTNIINYRRKENTLRGVDFLTGATIQVDFCSQGHSIRRCSCAEVKPIKFLTTIADSWSLVVR